MEEGTTGRVTLPRETLKAALAKYRQCLICLKIIQRGLLCCRKDIQEKLTMQIVSMYTHRALPVELRNLLYPPTLHLPVLAQLEEPTESQSSNEVPTSSECQPGRQGTTPSEYSGEEPVPPTPSPSVCPQDSPHHPSASTSTPSQRSLPKKSSPKRAVSKKTASTSGRNISNRHDRQCVFCGKEFRFPSKFAEHLRSHIHENPFPCPYCKKEFNFRASFHSHVKSFCHTRTQERRFSCAVCPKTFRTKAILIRHSKVHLSQRTLVPCTLCSATFKGPTGLAQHLKTKHQTNVTYSKCEECGKQFAHPCNYRAHLRRHQNIKRHSCIFCHKAFVTGAELLRHIARHTREQPHFCPECGRAFRERSSVREHLLAHHPTQTKEVGSHSCIFCGKGFQRKSRFESHICAHIGERGTPCKFCDKRFFSLKNLQVHHRYKHEKGESENKLRVQRNVRQVHTFYSLVYVKAGTDAGFKATKCNFSFQKLNITV